jgi:hypothetical protein
MKEQTMKKPITFTLEGWGRHIRRLKTKKEIHVYKKYQFYLYTDTEPG